MKITANTQMQGQIDKPHSRRTVVTVQIENQHDFSLAYLKDKRRLICAALGTPFSKTELHIKGSWAETRNDNDGFFVPQEWVQVVSIGTKWVELKDREGNSVFVDAHGIQAFQVVINTPEK